MLLHQMDGVMRAAARVILQLPRNGSITGAISKQLHWLDIRSRINFKLCLLAYKCQHNLAPTYLSELIVPVSSIESRSHLRSSSSGNLIVPRFSTATFGPRGFAVSAPMAWNVLPSELKCADAGLVTFRKKLKTYLFSKMSE